MILIGIGSNLAAPGLGSPRATTAAALAALPGIGATVLDQSSWYESEPVPVSDQPWFVNGVAAVATRLEPHSLLAALLGLEARFGRTRAARNAARTLDLDLLDYDSRRYSDEWLILPHPRLHERRFVLEPLCEMMPHWRHPVLGRSAAELLAALPPGQPMRRIGD